MRAVLVGLAVVLGMPAALAQEAASSCLHQCRPRDADVNGPAPRTAGPVTVVLYANVLGTATAPTVFFNTREPRTSDPTLDWDGEATAQGGLGRTLVHARLERSESDDAPAFEADAARTATASLPAGPLRLAGDLVLYFYASPRGSALDLGAHPPADLTAQIVRTSASRSETLATGTGTATLLAAVPGAAPIYEFRVPLAVANTTWRATAVDESLDLYVHLGAPAGPFPFRLHEDPDRAMRLLLPVASPFGATSLRLATDANGTTATLTLVPLLGGLDLGHGSVRLEAATAEGRVDLGHGLEGPHPVSAGGPDAPFTVAWRLSPSLASATLTAHALNRQGTYEAVATTTYPAAPVPRMPGASAASFLAAACGLVAALRRTR